MHIVYHICGPGARREKLGEVSRQRDLCLRRFRGFAPENPTNPFKKKGKHSLRECLILKPLIQKDTAL